MEQSSSLETLLAGVARHDRGAFASLYEATAAKLYGIVFRILKRRDIADDVLQEVYVRIWDRAGGFDMSKGSPITWMATIARNKALDEVRRKSFPSSKTDSDAEVAEVVSEEKSPLAALEHHQELDRLRQCLDKLDVERREMVLLAYRDGFSRNELGRRFSRPVGTIKTWLRGSLAQLKTCLSQ